MTDDDWWKLPPQSGAYPTPRWWSGNQIDALTSLAAGPWSGRSGRPPQPGPPPGPGSGGPAPTGPPMTSPEPMGQAPEAGGPEVGDWVSEPTYIPLIDIYDMADEVKIVVDTPGFEEDEITVEVDDDILVVTGERESEEAPDTSKRSRHTRIERPQRLERTVPLPPGIDISGAWAHHENGTTTITFEKNDTERHHQIGFQ